MADAKLDEEKIRKQAKAIMDEFIKALGKAGDISGEVGIEREEQTRTAKAAKQDSGFGERMLGNAPKKDSSRIIAEKRSW